MKTRITITKLIAITMAAGLLCGAGWPQPVEAQSGDGSVRFVSYASIGIARGRKVHLSVGNPEQATGTLTLSLSYYLAHGTNSVNSVPLYESGWIRVPPGGFGSSDVSRRDLNTEGEPETGRVQTLLKMVFEAPSGSNMEEFSISIEDIDEQTGEIAGVSLHEYGHGLDSNDHTLGIMPQHRLSYSVYNPNEEGSEPVRVYAYGYDSLGRLVSQKPPADLRPGELRRFDFNYDDLPLAGEPVTGRKQVRTVIRVVSMDGSERHVKRAVTMELVNTRTGCTQVGDYIFLTGNTVEL